MIERKTWKEFRDCKMLWWINRILHTFGWAICFIETQDGQVEVFPARVTFRGFAEDQDAAGFAVMSDWLKENADRLAKEANA
jgi:hypothetical protein